MNMPVSDPEIIFACLPHRPPILMVDGLIQHKPYFGLTSLTVHPNLIFIDNNQLAETGLIEHMAQSVALYAGYGYFLKNKTPPIGYIGSISNLTIYSLPNIHQQIHTQVIILQEFAEITLVELTTYMQDQQIAKGQMKTVVAK